MILHIIIIIIIIMILHTIELILVEKQPFKVARFNKKIRSEIITLFTTLLDSNPHSILPKLLLTSVFRSVWIDFV